MAHPGIIIKASLADTSVIADILGEAFYNDPIVCYAAGRPGLARHLFAAEFRHLYARLGCSFYIRNEQEQMIGCALWAKPGQRLDPSLLAQLNIAWAVFKFAGLGALQRGLALDAFLKGNHPQEPHCYLHAIGVKSTCRGQGVGSRLMAHGVKMADHEQVPAYLENSNELNLPLYQKYGFEVIEKKNTPNGGPPIWLMRRPLQVTNPVNNTAS